MTDNPQTTLKSTEVFMIARRRAQEAMAEIAESQMKTWAKFPPVGGPTDIIAQAILRAIEDVGVKHDH